MEMIQAGNLDLVANGRSYRTAQKCRRKDSQRNLWPKLWACSEYAAVTPSVWISNRCGLPLGRTLR